MNCEETRKELSAHPTLGRVATGGTLAHVAKCKACQAWWAKVQGLEARIQSWRAEAPPEALQARIAGAIETPKRSSWKSYFSLWKENLTMRRLSFAAAIALCAFCAVLGYYGVVLLSKPASAFDRMERAVSQVKRAHMIVWYNVAKSGPVNIEKVEEVWYQDHEWRTRTGDTNPKDSIIIGTQYYTYDPAQGKVVSVPELSIARNKPDFSLQALAGDYMPTGANPQTELIGTTTENGKTVQEIDLDLTDQGERMLFWVDESTGLPMRAEKQDLDYSTGQWILNGRFEFEFNDDVPESVFDPQTLAPGQ